jgi:deferrochelatase/peroxidase EfeB
VIPVEILPVHLTDLFVINKKQADFLVCANQNLLQFSDNAANPAQVKLCRFLPVFDVYIHRHLAESIS